MAPAPPAMYKVSEAPPLMAWVEEEVVVVVAVVDVEVPEDEVVEWLVVVE